MDYISSDLVEDVVMDCLAIEFLMNLDNEFESVYFDYLPESALIFMIMYLLHTKKIMIYWRKKIKNVVFVVYIL